MPAQPLNPRRLLPSFLILAAATALSAPTHAQYISPITTIELNTTPLDVAITPNSQWAIVAAGAADGTQFYRLDGTGGSGWSLTNDPAPGARLIAVSPDGTKAVVLGAWPESARVFDMTTPGGPGILGSFDLGGPGMDVAIAPNGQFTVVVIPGGENGGTGFINADGTGAMLFTGSGVMTTIPARMIAISPNSARTVVASANEDTGDFVHEAVQVWDTSVDPPELLDTHAMLGEAHDLEISSDGAFALVRTRSTATHPGSETRFINLADGSEFNTINPSTSPSGARSVAISPNRLKALALGGADEDDGTSVQFFDTDTLPFSGWGGVAFDTTPRDVIYTPNSAWSLVLEDDHWLLMEQATGGGWYGFTNDAGPVYPTNTSRLLAATADSTRIMVAGRTIVWMTSSCSGAVGGGAGYYDDYTEPHQLAMSPDDRWVAVRAGAGSSAISFWGVERWGQFDGAASTVSPSPDASNSIAISPDGHKAVALGGVGAAGEVVLFDVFIPCPADFNGDDNTTPADIAGFVAQWFDDVTNDGRQTDFNHNCSVEPADIAGFVSTWFTALATGSC